MKPRRDLFDSVLFLAVIALACIVAYFAILGLIFSSIFPGI